METEREREEEKEYNSLPTLKRGVEKWGENHDVTGSQWEMWAGGLFKAHQLSSSIYIGSSSSPVGTLWPDITISIPCPVLDVWPLTPLTPWGLSRAPYASVMGHVYHITVLGPMVEPCPLKLFSH
ncbi:unnamed protein product [Pleuronectes platessa]|uniref:Uncharacterized protein n=1 Tax=Pleuronectes platessa TaxID=8262 RepID=A0A9N7ZFW4_PLEPL|nr:unnamed protein product [Pleuronectes platessa]